MSANFNLRHLVISIRKSKSEGNRKHKQSQWNNYLIQCSHFQAFQPNIAFDCVPVIAQSKYEKIWCGDRKTRETNANSSKSTHCLSRHVHTHNSKVSNISCFITGLGWLAIKLTFRFISNICNGTGQLPSKSQLPNILLIENLVQTHHAHWHGGETSTRLGCEESAVGANACQNFEEFQRKQTCVKHKPINMKRHRQCIEIIIAWTNKLQNPLPLIRKYVCSMHVCFMYLRMCNHGHIHLTAPQTQMHLRNYDVYCSDHNKLDNNPVTSVTRKEFRGCVFQCSVWAPLSQ